MNIAKIISVIIVALTAVATASAWTFTYDGVGSSPFSGSGVAAYRDGFGGYNVAFNGGTTYGSAWGPSYRTSWGYQNGYGMTSLNVASHSLNTNLYRNTQNGYSGYVNFGSYAGPTTYYSNRYFYGPNPINYVGNSLYS